jgi:cytochrome c-type biogenesis protein CcmH
MNRLRRRLRLACLAALLALCATPAAASAATTCPRTTLGSIEGEVMCLQCGVPLNVAEDAPAAQRERAFIDQMIAHCATKPQIENALVAQYGDRVLALPRANGFGLSAYLVPAAALLAGLLIVGALALRWRRRRPAQAAEAAVGPAAPPDTAEARRLDADLERYRL